MEKYGKYGTILESLKQPKNMFFVHFTVIGIQEKNMDFHIIGTPINYLISRVGRYRDFDIK